MISPSPFESGLKIIPSVPFKTFPTDKRSTSVSPMFANCGAVVSLIPYTLCKGIFSDLKKWIVEAFIGAAPKKKNLLSESPSSLRILENSNLSAKLNNKIIKNYY
jgi:hypothetical protein